MRAEGVNSVQTPGGTSARLLADLAGTAGGAVGVMVAEAGFFGRYFVGASARPFVKIFTFALITTSPLTQFPLNRQPNRHPLTRREVLAQLVLVVLGTAGLGLADVDLAGGGTAAAFGLATATGYFCVKLTQYSLPLLRQSHPLRNLLGALQGGQFCPVQVFGDLHPPGFELVVGVERHLRVRVGFTFRPAMMARQNRAPPRACGARFTVAGDTPCSVARRSAVEAGSF